MTARLRSRAPYASFLVYAPQAQSELATRSRAVRDSVKNDTRGIIKLAALRIRERWDELGLDEFLGPDVALVPTPRSSPLKDASALWPARRICEELVDEGHGADVLALVERRTPVPKSAFAAKGKRPQAADHLASMGASQLVPLPHQRVTVVDDFVTTGATLLATASHVAALWPTAEVRCFALVRALSGDDVDIERLDVPAVGTITHYPNTGRTTRRP